MFTSCISDSLVVEDADVRDSYGPLHGRETGIVTGAAGISNKSLQYETPSKVMIESNKGSDDAKSDDDSCTSFYEYDYDDCGLVLGEKPLWTVATVNGPESLSPIRPSGALITEKEEVGDILDVSYSDYIIGKNQQRQQLDESPPISRRSSLPSSFGCGNDIDLSYDASNDLGYDKNNMPYNENWRKSKSLRHRLSLLFVGSPTDNDIPIEHKPKNKHHNRGKNRLYSKFKRRSSAKKHDDKSSVMSRTGNETFSIDSNDSFSSNNSSSRYNNAEKGNQQNQQTSAYQRRLSLPSSSYESPGSAIDGKNGFAQKQKRGKSRRRFSLLSVGTKRVH